MPQGNTVKGTWYTTTAVNARARPSTKAKRVRTWPKGKNIPIVDQVFSEGRWWLKSRWGRYYAKEYMAQGRARQARISSPVPGHGVTTPYGRRKAGLWRTKGYHTGDDHAAPWGADCVAVRDGKAFKVWDGVLGNCLLLYADNGRTYWYCHLSKYSVRDVSKVRRGQRIGKVGATGSGALGDHLHFEDHAGHSLSWWAPDRDPNW